MGAVTVLGAVVTASTVAPTVERVMLPTSVLARVSVGIEFVPLVRSGSTAKLTTTEPAATLSTTIRAAIMVESWVTSAAAMSALKLDLKVERAVESAAPRVLKSRSIWMPVRSEPESQGQRLKGND